ncbi:aromatic prenyltransferase [Aspergillus bertholletiae]|uniref:Aromatic prenyltransferase n=1 Tax=Aspergillus bertholletiae TaxID=1226010 RepID=A0A5N7B0B7_9EURO|nr:aromatic prenyltransferase [Aspergillus bertholletiae]
MDLLLLFRSIVLPKIGHFPDASRPHACARTRSILSYDGSPIEYCWKWNEFANDNPEIRFCIEPAGNGLCADGIPGGKLRATDGILAELVQRLPTVDLERYDHFRNSLRLSDWRDDSLHRDVHPGQGQIPRMSLAFEFTRKGTFTKVYFTPPGNPDNVPSFDTFVEAVRPICYHNTAGLDKFTTYLSCDTVGATLRPLVLAIDCVSPQKSRTKFYTETTMTTFTSVINVMTLGGQIPLTQSSTHELWALFRAVLGLDDKFSQDEQLPVQNPFQPSRAHPVDYYNGLLYYVNLTPQGQIPDVKLYLPVIRYGRSDADITRGLQQFMISRRRGQYVDGFQRAIETISQRQKAGNSHRIQTYIACAFDKSGSLSLTSYLNPGVYTSLEIADI